MSELVARANKEFLFGGMRLSFWHLNVSCFNREIEVLETDALVKWTLFEVSGIDESEDESKLVLRYHFEDSFEDEIVDRFYVVEDREDALSIVSGLHRDREHVYVGPGLFISIR